MATLARYRKMLVAALGVAATLAATIPPDSAGWRWAQLVLAAATVAGVRQVPNADPPTGLITSRPTVYRRPPRPAAP